MKEYQYYIFYSFIIILSASLRLINLGKENNFISDERYYVKDGWSIFKYGYETKWVENYSNLSTLDSSLDYANSSFYQGLIPTPLSTEYWSTHGPLGKMLIGLGMLPFEINNSFGWRFSAAIAGILITILTFLVAFMIFKSHKVSLLAGFFVAIDTLNLTMSRISYLDIFLCLFLLVAVFIVLLIKNKQSIYLYVALGAVIGLGCSIKWSFIFVALPAYIFIIIVNRNNGTKKLLMGVFSSIVLIPIFYVLTWLPWFINYAYPKANSLLGIVSLFIDDHIYKYNYALLFSGTGPLKSRSVEWFWASNPSIFFSQPLSSETSLNAYISMPNMILWVTGLVGVVCLTIWSIRLKNIKAILLPTLCLYLAIMPWAFYDNRIIYQWYSIIFEPLIMISAAFVIVLLSAKIKIIIPIFVFVALVTAPVFLPFSYGMSNMKNTAFTVFQSWKDFSTSYGLYDAEQNNPNLFPGKQDYLKAHPDIELYWKDGKVTERYK